MPKKGSEKGLLIQRTKWVLRSRYKKNIKRGTVQKRMKKGDAIQVDPVDFGELYAFTAIDTYTKEASVSLSHKLTAKSSLYAIKKALKKLKIIKHIQRDGGPEFKAYFEDFVRKYRGSLRTSSPYKKNEQAFIERFNCTLRKECLGWKKYKKEEMHDAQKQVHHFLKYYHLERPHLSLQMMTPNEFVSMKNAG